MNGHYYGNADVELMRGTITDHESAAAIARDALEMGTIARSASWLRM